MNKGLNSEHILLKLCESVFFHNKWSVSL